MTTGWKVALAFGGALLAGALLVVFQPDVKLAALALVLPAAGKPYAQIIAEAADEFGLNTLILAGLLEWESGFGANLTPPGPGGTADGGHGHGLAQIDDRTWGGWLATHDWTDPRTNIRKGAEILADNLKRFGGDYTKALAAYNAGPRAVERAVAAGEDPDNVTSGGKYVKSVLARAARLERAQLA